MKRMAEAVGAVAALGLALGGVGRATAGSVFTPLDDPGPTGPVAWGIGAPGRIVGGTYFDGITAHGFVLNGHSHTPLDVPGSTFRQAFRINDSGRVVGAVSVAVGRSH